jgi:hypothetical protein
VQGSPRSKFLATAPILRLSVGKRRAQLREHAAEIKCFQEGVRVRRQNLDPGDVFPVDGENPGREPALQEPQCHARAGKSGSGDQYLRHRQLRSRSRLCNLAFIVEAGKLPQKLEVPMATLQAIYLMPPFAVARLGASVTPLEAFEWAEDETAHGAGQTVIKPSISLEILADGSLRPYTPSTIRFRDGSAALIRPTAPFFELWGKFDDAAEPRPLTSRALTEIGGSLDRVKYAVHAANLKAARRTGDPACGFEAEIAVQGDDFDVKPLLASSPNIPGQEPLVSAAKPIFLGHIQVIRPRPGTSAGVDLDTLRLRITPGRGEVYGPPKATSARDPDNANAGAFVIVPEANRILNAAAAWTRFQVRSQTEGPEPSDTYDRAPDPGRGVLGQSWGVVDDTCDMVIEASVEIGSELLTARARATSAPPDFAPDRRPFVTLADDLADREMPPLDIAAPESVDEIADLLRRVLETVSMVNLDSLRTMMTDTPLPRNPVPVVGRDSMTAADKPLADQVPSVLAEDRRDKRLAYAPIAHDVHGQLADVDNMLALFQREGDRIRHLLRPPFARFKDLPAAPPARLPTDKIGLKPRERDPRVARDGLQDMRMPPYMRDSDGAPLSLTWRQYRAVIEFIARVEAAKPEERAKLSPALRHMAQVIARRGSKATRTPARPPRGSARRAAKKRKPSAGRPRG